MPRPIPRVRAKPGRPAKAHGPKLPRDVVEELLTQGELVAGEDGKSTRVWPSQREIARRFGVSASLVANVAKQLKAPRPEKPKASVAKVREPKPRAERNRPRGRPLKSQTPEVPIEELDRLLVMGEVVVTDDGASLTRYPTYQELAERYGTSLSYIGTYAKNHNCVQRRKTAQTRLAVRVEEKLLERRADAIALGKDDVVRMIDEYLLGFERALKEGRVRQDNPTDVNTLVRLKEFVQGGADSRQEVHAALSLSSIQERYAQMLKQQRDAPEVAGVLGNSTAPVVEVSHTETEEDNADSTSED